jgi:Family of unknown function (DUF5706)
LEKKPLNDIETQHMHYPESLKKVSDLATRLYLTKTDDRLFFHNLQHAVRLLESAHQMSAHYKLDEKNHFILCTAAWLYDLEMTSSGTPEREINNAAFSEDFLRKLSVEESAIREIGACILSNSPGHPPASLNEEIFSDALRYYFGSEYFLHYHNLLRRETEIFAGKKISGNEWRTRTISLLTHHEYHTDYCKSRLNNRKSENLKLINRVQEKKELQKQAAPARGKLKPIQPGLSHPAWKHKSRHHLSGVETVFRNASANHLNLSVMADNKAFIMISVNSILISIGVGLIIGKLVLIPKLFVPTVILLSVNVATIIYSVLATRPGIMNGKFSLEGIENKTVDLLFFGNFFKMPLADFEYGMRKMMDDDDFLYGNLIRDIYAQGKTLGRKFRLLRISYNLFMYGMAITVGAFVLSFFL